MFICYNGPMSEHKPRKVHIETVSKSHKGKVYKSVLLRRQSSHV